MGSQQAAPVSKVVDLIYERWARFGPDIPKEDNLETCYTSGTHYGREIYRNWYSLNRLKAMELVAVTPWDRKTQK